MRFDASAFESEPRRVNVEDRFFAACDRLNEVKMPPFAVLDWAKAEQIRARAAAGTLFGISKSLCCAVIRGASGAKCW